MYHLLLLLLVFIIYYKLITNFYFFFIFIVRLSDSILAFHKNGVQGRSLLNGEVTQEIIDNSRTYKLLGSDKYVLIKLT